MKFKMFTLLLIVGAVILFGLSLTSAMLPPEYQTVEFSTDYYSLMEKDVVYNESINIQTSVSIFSNFELTLWGDWKSGIVNVNIDGVDCSPSGWVTPSADGYQIRFDCTQAVNNAPDKKDLTLFYLSDKDAENVYGTIKGTYLTKGLAGIEVFGTEYTYGVDTIAKSWLQLLNSTGDDVTTGVCYVDIYSPEGEEYIENALMTNMVHDGVYYYDAPVPIGQGVYPVIAKCYYDAVQTDVRASAYTVYEGNDKDGGQVERSWEDDGADVEIETDNNIRATDQLDTNWTFDDFWGNCSGVSEDLLSSISIFWKGKWDTNDINHDIMVYFWNYTSSEYVELPNEITGGNGGDIFTVSNTLDTNNITKALGLSATNPLIVRYNDTLNAEGAKKFRTYYTYASCSQLANPEWQEVKGASEWHITSEHPWQIEITSGTIENATFPDFFYYNFTVESGVGVDTDDVEVHVDMPKPFPCHHVQSLSIDGLPVNITVLSNAENDALSKGCRVQWDMDLEVGVNYQGQIVADNWFKEIEVMWLTEMELQHAGVSLVCDNYRLAMGYPNYTLPRPDSENPFENMIDELYDVCYAYLDVYYHYNQSYFFEYYTPQGTFSAEDMLYLDNFYVHMVEGRDELDLIATSILNTMNAIGTYSVTILQDPNNLTETNWSIVYAAISSSYLNYAEIVNISQGLTNVSVDTSGITEYVWNYSDRQLTEFNFFNVTTIAEAVWSYATRVLTAFDFTIDTGLNNLTAEEVWENPNRNLTYTEPVSVDYGTLSDYVWNNTDRQLTAFDFLVETGLINLSAQDVWEYVNRTLTDYNTSTQTDLTNYTEIEKLITDRDDLTNYTLVQEIVTDYGNNNTDLTNYTLINQLIADRNDLTNYTLIEDIVVEFGNNNTDLTNYTLIADIVDNVSNSDLINDIWNYTNRSIDAYPAHQYLGGTEYFGNGSGKISVRLVQAQGGNSSVETGADCNITILNPNDIEIVSDTMTEFGEGVYTYDFTVSSTLGVYTYYSDCSIEDRSYFGLNTFHVWDINESEISQSVWDHDSRTLTAYVDVTDYDRIQEETWNASTRELTYYPTTNVTLSNDSIQELGDAVWQYNGTISNNILTSIGLKVKCYVEDLTGINDGEWGIDIATC